MVVTGWVVGGLVVGFFVVVLGTTGPTVGEAVPLSGSSATFPFGSRKRTRASGARVALFKATR